MNDNIDYGSDCEWSAWKTSSSERTDIPKSRSRSYEQKENDSKKSNSPIKRDDLDQQEVSEVEPSACIGVFGLARQTTEAILQSTFEKFGHIESVKLIMDRFTKESQGYGFIKFENIDSAQKAIAEANGMELDGRKIRVDFSKTKKAHTPTPGDYKGKVQNRNRSNNIMSERYPDSRPSRRSFQARSRSRSPIRGNQEMKYLNNGHSSRRGNLNKQSPVRYEPRRYSASREDNRRMTPKRYSPNGNNYREPFQSRRYSPQRFNNKREDQMRPDFRRQTEKRYDNRRFSPARNEYKRYLPERVESRKFSPQRDYQRRYSPVKNEQSYRQEENIRFSPVRNENRGYPQRREEVRRFSPNRQDERRFQARREEPMRNETRRYSPMRDDFKRSDNGGKRFSQGNSIGYEKKSYNQRSFNESDSRNYRENRR